MSDFLQSIADGFTAILDALASVGAIFVQVWEIIKAVGAVVVLLKSCVVFLVDVITAFPWWLLLPAGILIVVTVLYKVLGREVQS